MSLFDWLFRRGRKIEPDPARPALLLTVPGGYALGALARSVAAHLRVLADL